MKILFLLLFYVISIASSYSQNEKLYYYIENDSLLGVKNEIGKIIIPARRVFSPNIFEELLKDEIKENVIFFWEKNGGAKAYNRKGEFLFIPYFFDGAFDEFSEGFMRFEKDKKLVIQKTEDISKLVVECKNELEKIREQLANIE